MGARIPPHNKHAARKVAGLEAALVDNEPHLLEALDPGDSRSIPMKVAGPAALSVAKAYKLGERLAKPERLVNKDAHDLYRLLRATETEVVAEGYRLILNDERSRAVAQQALDFLRELFSEPSSVGSRMAGETEGSVGDPDTVAASTSALVGDLFAAVHSASLLP